jgi:anti-sigma regulatory factor (Ser/Thr protein kinase)
VTDATIAYAGADDIGTVRAFVSARAAALGLRPDRVELLALAISELVTNTLQHTRGGGHVRLWTAEGQLVADVVDSAPTGTRAEQWRAMPPAEAIRGRGLAIVEQICDAVELSAARVRVRFTL